MPVWLNATQACGASATGPEILPPRSADADPLRCAVRMGARNVSGRFRRGHHPRTLRPKSENLGKSLESRRSHLGV